MAIDERLLDDPEFLHEAATILKREITTLRAQLDKFGGHTAECASKAWKPVYRPGPFGGMKVTSERISAGIKCDCGWDEAKGK